MKEPLLNLFNKYLEDRCSDEEVADLLNYFKIPAEEHRLKQLILSELTKKEHLQIQVPDIDNRLAAIFSQVQKYIREESIQSAPHSRLWPRIAAAASILLCLSAAGYFLIHKMRVQPQLVHHQPLKNDLLPGSNKAILTLATGKQIILTGAPNGKLVQQGNTLVTKTADGQIIYNETNESAAAAVSYNTTSTPRGGQYHVVLADSTNVWLNAASSITYPTAFTGNDRTVTITGEVYFEVAHNATKPFRVKSNGQTVQVLGTHFNINAYQDEPATVTTLLEGSVKVSKGEGSSILKPGQQSSVTENGVQIKVTTGADPDLALAWKNGKFSFDETNIAEVMKQVARWYDVDIIYVNNIPDKRLSGHVSRNINASQALVLLKYAGINFKIEGRKIIVK